MTATPPAEGRCAHCDQPRIVFPTKPEWGQVPSPMCTSDWQLFAEARDNNTFVDWNDAFLNGTDDQLAAGLGGAT
ncbi:hypothetical protein ACFXKC_28430 [Streptomyces sp. NPDC059340]|uniref:hypothetical protein n=1 Tax=Streptomyces sp. NPDC059340 TaxID=3346806 RepID=UPI00368D3FC8